MPTIKRAFSWHARQLFPLLTDLPHLPEPFANLIQEGAPCTAHFHMHLVMRPAFAHVCKAGRVVYPTGKPLEREFVELEYWGLVIALQARPHDCESGYELMLPDTRPERLVAEINAINTTVFVQDDTSYDQRKIVEPYMLLVHRLAHQVQPTIPQRKDMTAHLKAEPVSAHLEMAILRLLQS